MRKKRKTDAPKAPKPTGRPTKFCKEFSDIILELARDGKTIRQIADTVGVAESTLYLWAAKYGGFSEALKRSKLAKEELVETALLQRALGYRHPDAKFFYDAERGEIVTKEFTKVYPPSEDAARFWLQNRRPKRWKDKKELGVSGTITLEQLIASSVEEKKK